MERPRIIMDRDESEAVNVLRPRDRESVSRADDGYRVHSDRLSRIAQMVNVRDLRVVDQIFNEMVRVGLDKKMEEPRGHAWRPRQDRTGGLGVEVA